MRYYDNWLHEPFRKQVYEFLCQAGWTFGWKSNPKDNFSFWHKHFAGSVFPDHEGKSQYDCADELKGRSALLYAMWELIKKGYPNDTIVRCYANGQPYGCEGGIHTDSISPNSFTFIYYPHLEWFPNWGGETMFFKDDYADAIAVAYPKPGRLICFPGTVPHVARPVSRNCPVMRVTLMFKTERRDNVAKDAFGLPANAPPRTNSAQQPNAAGSPHRDIRNIDGSAHVRAGAFGRPVP